MRIRIPHHRAAFWATVIVVPSSVVFYIDQFTHLVHGTVVLGLIAYLLCLPLFPGVILTGLVVAIVMLNGNRGVGVAVVSHQFTVVMPVLNWIFYFVALLLIFRRLERVRLRSV